MEGDEGRPVVTIEAASAPDAPALLARVTRDRTLRTPTKIIAASMTRVVTKPSAAASLCRLATGKRATAVPMPANAKMTSPTAPQSTPLSLPAWVMYCWLVSMPWYSGSVGIETKVTR